MMKTTRPALIIASTLVFGGCAFAPKVSVSTPAQVIVKHSYGSPESTMATADAECKKYGPNNTAVFKTMALDSFANSFAFDCVKK